MRYLILVCVAVSMILVVSCRKKVGERTNPVDPKSPNYVTLTPTPGN